MKNLDSHSTKHHSYLHTAREKPHHDDGPNNVWPANEIPNIHGINYQKIEQLLQHRHSAHMYERHAAAIHKLVKIYSRCSDDGEEGVDAGLPLKDLGHLTTILGLVRQKISEGGEAAQVLVKPVEKFLAACCTRIVYDRTLKDQAPQHFLTPNAAFFSEVASFVTVAEGSLTPAVANAIYNLTGGTIGIDSHHNKSNNKRHDHMDPQLDQHHRHLHDQYHQNMHNVDIHHRNEREPHFFAPPFGPDPFKDGCLPILQRPVNSITLLPKLPGRVIQWKQKQNVDMLNSSDSSSRSNAGSPNGETIRFADVKSDPVQCSPKKGSQKLNGRKRDWAFDFQDAVELSEVAGRLASALCASASANLGLDPTVLRTLKHLTASSICCQQISEENTLVFLAEALARGTDYPTGSILVQLIWNLLESEAGHSAAAQLRTQTCLSDFCDILKRLEGNGHRQVDRQHRNEIVIVLSLIARYADDNTDQKEFRDSGLLSYILKLLLTEETEAEKGKALPNGNEDFHFKQLLLQLIPTVCQDDESLELALNNHFLDYLHSHLSFETSGQLSQFFSRRQFKDLQEQILSILSSITPRLPTTVTIRSIPVYLDFLLAAIHDQRDAMAIGRSKFDSSTENITLISATLIILLRIADMGDEERMACGKEGVVQTALYVLKEHSQNLDVHRNSLLLLASLCQGFPPNRQLYSRENGVLSILPCLRFESADYHEKEFVLLAAIDCIWGAVCGDNASEEAFFQNEGIFLLLDLLETSSPKLQRHSLGCLLDLLENPKARMHFLEWQSDREESIGIAELLIRLWNEEENSLGIVNGPHGVLSQRSAPLVGSRQYPRRDMPKDVYSADETTPWSVSEIDENLRAKIYGVFCKLGFDAFPNLSVEGKVKLAMIERFLDFKVGEVWNEIETELRQMNIRPITPDQQCIDEAIKVITEKADNIQKLQLEIINKEQEEMKREEQTFYARFLELARYSSSNLSLEARGRARASNIRRKQRFDDGLVNVNTDPRAVPKRVSRVRSEPVA